MKRLLQHASSLTRDELVEEIRRLTTLYSEQAHLVTCRFFSETEELFVHHILLPLSRTIPLPLLLRLTRVCQHWRRLVFAQVRHLNFACDTESFLPAVKFCLKQFPQWHSLSTHHLVLAEYHYRLYPAMFSRLTSLELTIRPMEMMYRKDDDDGGHWWQGNVPLLTNLTALRAPTFPWPGPWCGEDLTRLTALTHLEIDCSLCGHVPLLTRLTALQHLVMSNFPPDFDATPLRALTHLESDHITHFARFTGTGVLDEDQDPSEQDDDDREREERCSALLAGLAPGCFRARLVGQWERGVFSGDAELLYWSDSDSDDEGDEPKTHTARSYRGEILDGRREGRGDEHCPTKHVGYRGEWRAGRRHGRGVSYVLSKADEESDHRETQWACGEEVSSREG